MCLITLLIPGQTAVWSSLLKIAFSNDSVTILKSVLKTVFFSQAFSFSSDCIESDSIRMDEVRAALKEMKRHKAQDCRGW